MQRCARRQYTLAWAGRQYTLAWAGCQYTAYTAVRPCHTAVVVQRCGGCAVTWDDQPLEVLGRGETNREEQLLRGPSARNPM